MASSPRGRSLRRLVTLRRGPGKARGFDRFATGVKRGQALRDVRHDRRGGFMAFERVDQPR